MNTNSNRNIAVAADFEFGNETQFAEYMGKQQPTVIVLSAKGNKRLRGMAQTYIAAHPGVTIHTAINNDAMRSASNRIVAFWDGTNKYTGFQVYAGRKERKTVVVVEYQKTAKPQPAPRKESGIVTWRKLLVAEDKRNAEKHTVADRLVGLIETFMAGKEDDTNEQIADISHNLEHLAQLTKDSQWIDEMPEDVSEVAGLLKEALVENKAEQATGATPTDATDYAAIVAAQVEAQHEALTATPILSNCLDGQEYDMLAPMKGRLRKVVAGKVEIIQEYPEQQEKPADGEYDEREEYIDDGRFIQPEERSNTTSFQLLPYIDQMNRQQAIQGTDDDSEIAIAEALMDEGCDPGVMSDLAALWYRPWWRNPEVRFVASDAADVNASRKLLWHHMKQTPCHPITIWLIRMAARAGVAKRLGYAEVIEWPFAEKVNTKVLEAAVCWLIEN